MDPVAAPCPRAPRRLGRLVAGFLLGAAAFPPPGTGQASAAGEGRPPGLDLPVRTVTLDNGMRFLVLPRPGAPTVSFVTHYAVGGVDETLGTTGIAHLLEHMLFKGTTTVGTRDLDEERRLFRLMDAAQDSLLALEGRPPTAAAPVLDAATAGAPGDSASARLRSRIRALEDSARAFTVSNEFDRILTRAGARGLNAMTTNEATIYFVELPANRAELWFVLEADRMLNPVFREFYAERDVVMEERRMRVETSPGGRLYEEHLAAAYRVHPYRQPVVGWASDLAHHTREEVAAYYRRYYGPRNAVVAIVGDLDPDRVERWAREYFSRVPPGETPPPVLAEEPPQEGERRIEVLFEAEPSLRVGWHVVDPLHPDHPALVMLSSILTGGRTSRLYRRMVLQDRVATSVTSSLGPGERHPLLFTLDVTPRAPHGTADAEAVVYEELERLRDTPPESVELERVRNQTRAGAVRRLQSNLGLAFQLASSEAVLGDWRTTFRLGERLGAVTPEDVQRVVRTYFTPANRTVGVLRRPDASGTAAGSGASTSGDTPRPPGEEPR